ncbi:hypothetical protein HJG60_009476 [Phyllostomus discolor]|uniref:Uncharacterized protein n=1 Tax=Phyllostomus discolor TaxID=89673 RepID=A0A833Y954_9CHIR|nr:hypothetical protein HJG60_009476 [Phyllostomus discolor]
MDLLQLQPQTPPRCMSQPLPQPGTRHPSPEQPCFSPPGPPSTPPWKPQNSAQGRRGLTVLLSKDTGAGQDPKAAALPLPLLHPSPLHPSSPASVPGVPGLLPATRVPRWEPAWPIEGGSADEGQ